MRVGVLALQGGFAAHVAALRALGHEAIELRDARDLESDGDGARVDGLVLPGGESTAIRHLLARDGGVLLDRMRALHACGAPILATCAGLVLVAREVRDPPATSLGWLDVAVTRNGWGRQVASGTTLADDERTPLVLIRAPRIVAHGPAATVLATLRGEPVLVRQGTVVGATFHPELTSDLSVHRAAFGV
jgi:5'-phosphate synthase pdxT subunit